MDSFFGIGFPELVLILILAGLVMGPQRIRQVARFLGRFVAQVQGLSRQFTQQLNSELDALDNEDIRGAMDDMQELRRQLADLQRQVRTLPTGAAAAGKAAVEEGKAALKGQDNAEPAKDKVTANGNTTSPPASPPPAGESSPLPRPIEIPDDPE